jgi:hypothetical protein
MSDINTDVEGGEEAREAAEARWKAVEAFNAAPGLPPAAKAIGIALICAMDANSRACFPSEEWLAAMTGLSTRAVRYGKAKLRAVNLITWVNQGQAGTGPHSSRYGFNYAALERLSTEAKERARLAVEKRRQVKAATSFRFNKEAHCRIKQDQQQSKRQIPAAKAAIFDTKPEAQFLPNRKPSSAEPPTYPPTRTAQPEHDAAPACAASAAVAPSPHASREGGLQQRTVAKSEPAETARALEESSRPKLRPFPKLWNAFEGEEDEADILDRLDVLPHDVLTKASRVLAMSGKERALEIIWGART